jgi:peroxiredoxin family protein
MPEETKNERKKLSMIIFSGEMDKLIAAFSIATGAAASDMDVAMFFTFWGFRALKKGPTGKTFMGKMIGMMEGGGLEKAGPSKYNMGGIGRWMFKKMMGAKKVPTLVEFRQMAIDLGVKFYACQQTMDMMEIPDSSLIDEVTDKVGVGFMIELAQESVTTMFI